MLRATSRPGNGPTSLKKACLSMAIICCHHDNERNDHGIIEHSLWRNERRLHHSAFASRRVSCQTPGSSGQTPTFTLLCATRLSTCGQTLVALPPNRQPQPVNSHVRDVPPLTLPHALLSRC